MNAFFIQSKNVNLEIIAKLLNSVAKKYDCHVQYLSRNNCLEFYGEEACWRHIAEEVMEFFFPKSRLSAVMVRSDNGC